MTQPLRVLIVGAGIGGLALAQALVAAGGIDVRIHERNPDADAWLDGYRININPDGARALSRCLPTELWEAFVATSTKPPGGISFRTERLRELYTITREEMTGGSDDPADGQYGVSRRALRTLLLAGLEDHVRYGSEFDHYTTDADGTVTVHFADGSTAVADVLVGADGANSRVRRQYLPDAERVASGTTAIGARLPLDDSTRAWLPSCLSAGMTLVMPPSGRWSMFTSAFAGRGALTGAISRGIGLAGRGVDEDRLLDDADDYVLWSVIADDRALPHDVLQREGAELRELAVGMVGAWHPALRRVITDTDPTLVHATVFRQSRLIDPWPGSTVTVLGDAIHNMTPVGGLGANTALRDAAALADALRTVADGAPLVPSIEAYEARMREWGYAAVRASGDNARRATSSGPVARRAGRAYFRVRGALRRWVPNRS
ncbi:FAD-dependent monooxygenase [Actinomycetospora chiangmaiensis]|uniref:FAD-dependent monooxygenase n=1 Tax=Actinomycetospora chiangmaiensis TaxID=402650 RepID=UPI00037806A7|nr:NAD(P)/FAD-dependent oxidoreductase [Actinomycetospora chiangmaiensis]